MAKKSIPGLTKKQSKVFTKLTKQATKAESKGKDFNDKKEAKLNTLSGYAEAGANYQPVTNVTGLTQKGLDVYNQVASIQAAGQDLKKGDQKVLDKLSPYVESQRMMDESKAAMERALDNLNKNKGANQEQLAQMQAEFARQQQLYEEQRKANEAQLAEMQKRSEEDRRNSAARESSRFRARRRGAGRALLSSARLNPEMGLGAGASTLGKATV